MCGNGAAVRSVKANDCLGSNLWTGKESREKETKRRHALLARDWHEILDTMYTKISISKMKLFRSCFAWIGAS